jgi:protein-S-isoprenylcysteine O-methyltransferase Ste14
MSRWQYGLSSLIILVLMMGSLFGSAGRWDLPMFWAYTGIWLVVLGVAVSTLDLDLMRERVRPGAGSQDNLKLLRRLGFVLFMGQFALAGLDAGRYHWSDTVPLGLQIGGLIGFAAAMAIVVWAQRVNRFFSSAVRIQRDRGHHVITTGPYQYVRHPGYAAFILGGLCGGLALGSWSALLPPMIFGLLFVRRTALEDQFLQEELQGYAEYARRVRYRLVPGVW